MSTVVTGLFDNVSDASAAVHTLGSRGMPTDNMSLLVGEQVDMDAFAIETHSKLPEGVALGATGGGAVGALVGGLAAVGAVAAGGAGVLAAGPIVAAFAAAGAGATGGALVGGVVGLAIPEHEVKHYDDALEKGSVLIGVECDDSDVEDLVRKTFSHFDVSQISTA